MPQIMPSRAAGCAVCQQCRMAAGQPQPPQPITVYSALLATPMPPRCWPIRRIWWWCSAPISANDHGWSSLKNADKPWTTSSDDHLDALANGFRNVRGRIFTVCERLTELQGSWCYASAPTRSTPSLIELTNRTDVTPIKPATVDGTGRAGQIRTHPRRPPRVNAGTPANSAKNAAPKCKATAAAKTPTGCA